MNKSDLAVIVSQAAGISNSSAKRTVDAVVKAVGTALKNGDKVTLTGFGTFKVSRTKAREARNPKTGETIKVKAKNRPVFTAGQTLKNQVN